jgi:hypothetical protein
MPQSASGTYASTLPCHEAWMRSLISPSAVSWSIWPARRRPVSAPSTAMTVQTTIRPAIGAARRAVRRMRLTGRSCQGRLSAA